MKQFNPINRPNVPTYSLDVLTQGYNTMEQGHKEAIKASSDLETAMASLDLNDAEDEWRHNKINEIKQTISDNSTYGNAYTALDDIIKKAGDLSSDQGMIGRLRSQRDYKAFQTQLDKRTDIPEDYKDYFRAANTYTYEDKKNSKGEVIGSTKWEPSDTPTETVPLNKMLDQGLAWAAKQAGGSTQHRWVDFNGNIVTKASMSSTGEYFSKDTGKWEKLTKEKLRAGVRAAIETTPGAKESFDQDYKIAKWKYDKNDKYNPDITNKDGLLLTSNEYLEKRIDPFYDAATYHNYFGSTEYGNAIKAQLAIGAGNTIAKTSEGNLVTVTNPVKMANFMPARAQSESTAAKQKISDALQFANPNFKFDINNKTNDQILDEINKATIDPIIKMDLQRDLETITRNEEYLNALKEGKTEDEKSGFDTYNAVMSMSDLPNNKHSKKLTESINNIFDGAAAFRNYMKPEAYDNFIATLGGEGKARDLGIIVGSKNGKKYVELPANKSRAFYSFAKGLNNSGSLDFMSGDFYRIDDKGDEISAMQEFASPTKNVVGGITNTLIGTKLFNKGVKKSFNEFLGTVNNLKTKNDAVLNGGNIVLGQQTIQQATPDLAEVAAIIKAGGKNAEENSFTYKLREDEVERALKNMDLVQKGALIVGDNNTLEPMSSEKRKEYTAFLRNAKLSDVSVVSMQDPQSSTWGPLITIMGKNEEGKIKVEPIVIYSPDGFDSEMYQSWNRDTKFRAKNDVNVYHATNRPLYINNATAFADVDKFKLVPNGSNFELINDTDKKTISKNIDKSTAVKFMDLYNQWDDTYNAVRNGVSVDINAVSGIAQETANMLATFNSNYNENTIKYYYDKLMSNINIK